MIRNAQKKDKATEADSITERNNEIDRLREKVDQLEQQNFELTSELSKAEEEKWNLALMKHQDMTQLAAEFESVRKELDQVCFEHLASRTDNTASFHLCSSKKLLNCRTSRYLP